MGGDCGVGVKIGGDSFFRLTEGGGRVWNRLVDGGQGCAGAMFLGGATARLVIWDNVLTWQSEVMVTFFDIVSVFFFVIFFMEFVDKSFSTNLVVEAPFVRKRAAFIGVDAMRCFHFSTRSASYMDWYVTDVRKRGGALWCRVFMHLCGNDWTNRLMLLRWNRE